MKGVINFFVVGCILIACQGPVPVFDERKVGEWVKKTSKMSALRKQAGLDSILYVANADSLCFRKTVDFLERPFINPASALRNDTLAIMIYKSLLASKHFMASEKVQPLFKMNVAMQNNPGSKCNDFEFILPNGDRKRLSSIESKYTLLFFYNPDCPACKEFKHSLESSRLSHDERLTIVGVYTDSDIALWERSLNEVPKLWIVGRDENESLYKKGVFDLSAIPSAYLLDENKVVMLKDISIVDAIEDTL